MAPIAEFAGLKDFLISADPPLDELAVAWEQIVLAAGMSERDLLDRISRHFHVPVARLGDSTADARARVSAELAEAFGVLPLRLEGDRLVVATADPAKPDMAETLSDAAETRVAFEVAPPAALVDAIRLLYCEESAAGLAGLVAEAASELATPVFGGASRWGTVFSEDLEPDPPAVVALSNATFETAVDSGASDVHFDPSIGEGMVRFRVDGVLRDVQAVPGAVLEALVRRVRLKSGLPPTSEAERETGVGRLTIGGSAYSIKLVSASTADGAKVSVSIDLADRDFQLESLELDPNAFEQIRTLLAQPNGLFLVSGPAGSGITTLVYSILARLARGGGSVSTLENPIELDVPGVAQRQFDASEGMSYSEVLYELIGGDSDVLFLGEVRDEGSAAAGLRAGITGRRVFGTLHGRDAVGALDRLGQLGVDPSALAESLRGIVAQRLLRKVCSCARPVSSPADVSDRERTLALQFRVVPRKAAVGCERCGGTGYRGQVPVTEVLVITPDVTRLLKSNAPHHKIEAAALSGGMTPMIEQALARVLVGETTLQEVERVLGAAAPVPKKRAPGGPVLVVDDAAEDRAMIRAVLERKGLDVAEAETAESAREILKARGASLVLLDLRLPGEDGLSLLTGIRAAVGPLALPVIVLTSSQDPGDEIALLQAGADDFLLKPIDPRRLSVRIDAALRRVSAPVP